MTIAYKSTLSTKDQSASTYRRCTEALDGEQYENGRQR